MKSAWKVICILLMCWLPQMPMHALGQVKFASPKVAKAKAAEVAKAKAKARIKAKAKAQAGIKVKTKATSLSSRGTAMAASPAAVDESSLAAEVVAARRIVIANPGDVTAWDRLARAAVSLIDLLLQAEAVGDRNKAQRLAEKLEKDLHDTSAQMRKMAQNGDLKARQAMGVLLGRGVLLERDPARSCVEFLAAAEELAPAGWHAAQCLLETSPEKAWVQMERAAQRGHAAAQEWMGRRCLGEFGAKEKDFACARTYLVESASMGRSRAQTLLAYLLISGQGGPVDVSRGIRLYKVAAEQGDADAQNNLGEIYEMGRGVARDLDEAMRWYELAAQKGLGSAQFNAGRLWAIGAGQSKDPAKARAFLVQAEGNGVPQARQVLDWLDRQNASATDASPAQESATASDRDAPKN